MQVITVKMGSTTLRNVVDDLAIELNDTDFSATFDGHLWTVDWKWSGDEHLLKNQCSEYAVQEDYHEYDKGVQQWIDDW